MLEAAYVRQLEKESDEAVAFFLVIQRDPTSDQVEGILAFTAMITHRCPSWAR